MQERYQFSEGFGILDVLDSKVDLPDEIMTVVRAAWDKDKDNGGFLFLERGSDELHYYNSYSLLYEAQRRAAEDGVAAERMSYDAAEPVVVEDNKLPLPDSYRDVSKVSWAVGENHNYFVISEEL